MESSILKIKDSYTPHKSIYTMLQYYLAFLPLLIFAIFALLLYAKKWVDDYRWTQLSEERTLRSPGQSRRSEIVEIDSKINDCVIYIGIAVAVQIIAFTFLTSTLSGTVLTYLLSSMSLMTVSFSLWYLIKTATLVFKRSHHADGYHGERITGDQLSILMLEGYRVFHDLQFDGFNIDHVLVGPGGVFTVETVLKRKRKSLKEPNVRFDGAKLHWPTGRPNELGIQTAFDRSITLKQFLSNALGGSVEVKPLLLFPGWQVETEQKGQVAIMGPKQVHAHVKIQEEYDEVINERMVNRLSRHIAEKAGYKEPVIETIEEAEERDAREEELQASHAPMEPIV